MSKVIDKVHICEMIVKNIGTEMQMTGVTFDSKYIVQKATMYGDGGCHVIKKMVYYMFERLQVQRLGVIGERVYDRCAIDEFLKGFVDGKQEICMSHMYL